MITPTAQRLLSLLFIASLVWPDVAQARAALSCPPVVTVAIHQPFSQEALVGSAVNAVTPIFTSPRLVALAPILLVVASLHGQTTPGDVPSRTAVSVQEQLKPLLVHKPTAQDKEKFAQWVVTFLAGRGRVDTSRLTVLVLPLPDTPLAVRFFVTTVENMLDPEGEKVREKKYGGLIIRRLPLTESEIAQLRRHNPDDPVIVVNGSHVLEQSPVEVLRQVVHEEAHLAGGDWNLNVTVERVLQEMQAQLEAFASKKQIPWDDVRKALMKTFSAKAEVDAIYRGTQELVGLLGTEATKSHSEGIYRRDSLAAYASARRKLAKWIPESLINRYFPPVETLKKETVPPHAASRLAPPIPARTPGQQNLQSAA